MIEDEFHCNTCTISEKMYVLLKMNEISKEVCTCDWIIYGIMDKPMLLYPLPLPPPDPDPSH